MALKIYLDSAKTNAVSSGTNANPISTSSPTSGSTVEKQLWLANDDATKYYTSVNIDPTDSTGPDESTWVYLAPDNAGVAGTYGAAGAALSFANIGASGSGDTTAHPFCYKVVVPADKAYRTRMILS